MRFRARISIDAHLLRFLSKHAQTRQRLAIARAFGEHRFPQPPHFGMIAALGSQHRQVAPGEMAVDPLVDTAKLIGTLQRQNQPPAFLGLGRFAPLPMHHPLAKPYLGIFRIELEPLGTCGQRARESPII